MKSKVKKTIVYLLYIALFVFVLLVGVYMLVILFMAGEPMDLTLAIILSILLAMYFYLTSYGIEELIRGITALIRLEEKKQEEHEEEEEE